MSLNVGVVGATGMVGEVFLDLLKERNFPLNELKLFASPKSKGQTIYFNDKEIKLEILAEGCFIGLDIVFFSSGDEISKDWAPIAVKEGAFAIDNSAAFRLDDDIPLVVPEINAHLLPKKDNPCIIANPNCSTIQLVVALEPLKKKFGLNKVNVSTYQSVSGGGKDAQKELLDQQLANGHQMEIPKPNKFSKQIFSNCIPEIGDFDDKGYCTEEMKIINESRKILEIKDLKINAFTVRVPTLNGHSEAVWATLDKEVSAKEVRAAFEDFDGLVVKDKPQFSEFPTVIDTDGNNPVYVGRIHRDLNDPKTWIFWVVGDNIRKGAALNGIQIAEKLFL